MAKYGMRQEPRQDLLLLVPPLRKPCLTCNDASAANHNIALPAAEATPGGAGGNMDPLEAWKQRVLGASNESDVAEIATSMRHKMDFLLKGNIASSTSSDILSQLVFLFQHKPEVICLL